MIEYNIKYEYNIVTRSINSPLTSKEMDLYGISRWELVQVIQRGEILDYIFKRIRQK